MGIFSSSLNITRGKYNLDKVSGNPILKEDVLKDAQDKELMTALFNLFDVEGGEADGILTPYEQCRMVDVFKKLDSDGNGKLSKQEFADAAIGTNLDGDLLRDFFKRVMKSMKRRDKVSAREVYEYEQSLRNKNNANKPENTETPAAEQPVTNPLEQSQNRKPAPASQASETPVETETPAPTQGAEKPEKKQKAPQAPKAEKPENPQQPQAPKSEKPEQPKLYDYTVQMDESFTQVIKKSLAAQGNTKPTKAEIEAAKEEFKKNNPKAVRKMKNGYEILLVGAKVKLTGNVENKNNSKEQIEAWNKKYVKSEQPAAEKPAEKPQEQPAEAPKGVNPEESQGQTPVINPDNVVVTPDTIPNTGIEVAALANGDTICTETKDNVKTETRYDKDGNIKNITEEKYAGELLAQKTIKDKDGNVQQVIDYLYYEDGREAQRTYKDKDGNIIGTAEVSYESEKNPDVVRKELLKDGDGNPLSGVVQYKDQTIDYYHYNKDGNPTKIYTRDKDGKTIKSATMDYYENGLPQRISYSTKDGTDIYWYNQDGSYEHTVMDKDNKVVKTEYCDKDDNPITKEDYDKRKPAEA